MYIDVVMVLLATVRFAAPKILPVTDRSPSLVMISVMLFNSPTVLALNRMLPELLVITTSPALEVMLAPSPKSIKLANIVLSTVMLPTVISLVHSRSPDVLVVSMLPSAAVPRLGSACDISRN